MYRYHDAAAASLLTTESERLFGNDQCEIHGDGEEAAARQTASRTHQRDVKVSSGLTSFQFLGNRSGSGPSVPRPGSPAPRASPARRLVV